MFLHLNFQVNGTAKGGWPCLPWEIVRCNEFDLHDGRWARSNGSFQSGLRGRRALAVENPFLIAARAY